MKRVLIFTNSFLIIQKIQDATPGSGAAAPPSYEELFSKTR